MLDFGFSDLQQEELTEVPSDVVCPDAKQQVALFLLTNDYKVSENGLAAILSLHNLVSLTLRVNHTKSSRLDFSTLHSLKHLTMDLVEDHDSLSTEPVWLNTLPDKLDTLSLTTYRTFQYLVRQPDRSSHKTVPAVKLYRTHTSILPFLSRLVKLSSLALSAGGYISANDLKLLLPLIRLRHLRLESNKLTDKPGSLEESKATIACLSAFVSRTPKLQSLKLAQWPNRPQESTMFYTVEIPKGLGLPCHSWTLPGEEMVTREYTHKLKDNCDPKCRHCNPKKPLTTS